MKRATATNLLRSRGFVHLAYLAASALFAVPYYCLSEPASPAWIPSPFAWRLPYQFRILVPAIEYLCKLCFPLSWSFFHVTFAILSTYAVLLCFRRLLFFFHVSHPDLLSLAILYPLAWNYILIGNHFFASDIPSIAFFILTLLFALKKQWFYFYPLFILALFNRESIIFVIPAYLLLMFPLKDNPALLKTVLGHVVLQMVLFIAVKGLLLYLFRNNPGTPFDNMIAGNVFIIHLLLQGRFHTWGYPILCFGGLHILALLLIRWIPRQLRRLFLLFPLFLVVMFVVGWLVELRIYNELVPVVTLLAIVGIQQAFASRFSKPSEAPPY
jgi:hypothetical protein